MPKLVKQGDNTMVGNNTWQGTETVSGTLDVTGTFKLGGTTVSATAAELNASLAGVTATAAEINMAADNSANVETVAATNVITAAESGKTFFLNHATEFVSTLPAPAAGLRYKFIVANAPETASYTVVTNGGANIIEGIADVNGSAVPAVNEDTITFTDGAAAVGDWVEVISDGTSWFVSGQGVAATAIAFTAT